MKKNFIAIILARGGSKGIKMKNLTKINGKPLIYWSIKSCLNSKKIHSTWVSSDNIRILNYSKKIGAKIILRPKKYAKDNTSSEKSWLHAVNFLKDKINFENIVGLQPTSPKRDHDDLDNAIKIYKKDNLDSLFSSTEILDRFVWKKKGSKLIPNYNYLKRPRRQDLPTTYLENGSFYIFNKNKFLKVNNRLFGKIGVYQMKKTNSFQIDDKIDINILNLLFKDKSK